MSRTNLILITSHDIGRRLGCYGHGEVRSPALDGLAAEGALFRNAFCTQGICSPSRASIYTGRYPHSNGVMGLIHDPFRFDLHPEETHLAHLLKRDGYRTARAGLQHETARPEEMGFDEIDPGKDKWGASVADAAVRFLDGFAEKPATPFYLQVGFYEGHREPGHPNHEWGPMPPDDPDAVTLPGYLEDNRGTREEFAALHGSIRSLDAAVGRILSAIDERGLRDNTLVLFTADHGIPFPRAKATCYDPGLGVALLMRGPHIPAGCEASGLVSNVDLLPTLSELLGFPCPENVQGRSFAGLFLKRPCRSRSYVFGEQNYHGSPDPVRCVRSATHKLIVNFLPVPAIVNTTRQWRPVSAPAVKGDPFRRTRPLAELYDLEEDPWEMENRIDDPACAGVRAELLAALRAHMRETADPLCAGLPLPPRFRDALDLVGVEPEK